ncbi:MAG: hypothetical protein WDZ63_03335 [Burkholderiales bacterium]
MKLPALLVSSLFLAPLVSTAAPVSHGPDWRVARASEPTPLPADRAARAAGDHDARAGGAYLVIDDYLFLHGQAVRGESRTVLLPWPELRYLTN